KPTPAPPMPVQTTYLGSGATGGGRQRDQQSSGAPAPTSGGVELNSATVDMLDSLPGIGRKRAEDIVRYRQQHGAFRNINQLQNIRGMGPKMIARLRPHLRL
ncbi:MAG: helix-hairpin-helix domain-containing protein, partial [Candidatus Sericytochromatia bacterium]|nr:helix-hairpin-helix domain-containing protein [Candidatus Sericytochromatia bacterium]